MQRTLARVRQKAKSSFRPRMIASTIGGFPVIVIVLFLGGPFLTGSTGRKRCGNERFKEGNG